MGLVFLMTGLSKVTGNKMQVQIFDHLRLPQWFRFITGLVQLVGVAGLIIGIWEEKLVLWAGLWLAITMFFGMLAHVRIKDPAKSLIAPFGLMVIMLIIVFLQ